MQKNSPSAASQCLFISKLYCYSMDRKVLTLDTRILAKTTIQQPLGISELLHQKNHMLLSFALHVEKTKYLMLPRRVSEGFLVRRWRSQSCAKSAKIMIMDSLLSHGVLKQSLTWVDCSECIDEQALNRQEEIRTRMNSSCRIFHRRDCDHVFDPWNAYH